MKPEQLPLYTFVERKKERIRERKQDFRRATINTHITIRAYLGLSKTRELMHDGGEMTTTGRDMLHDGGEMTTTGRDMHDGGEMTTTGRDMLHDGGERLQQAETCTMVVK